MTIQQMSFMILCGNGNALKCLCFEPSDMKYSYMHLTMLAYLMQLEKYQRHCKNALMLIISIEPL
jgi:hypothetical protein